MKEKEDVSSLDLICLFTVLIILFFFLGCSLSIYESVKVKYELKSREQTKKIEITNKREPIKRLYKDAFKERK